MIYQALAAGHAFIGYDLPAPTKGFRFTAHTEEQTYLMGDQIEAGDQPPCRSSSPRRPNAICSRMARSSARTQSGKPWCTKSKRLASTAWKHIFTSKVNDGVGSSAIRFMWDNQNNYW